MSFLWFARSQGLPEFTDVYGTMPCRWDGGRVSPYCSTPMHDPDFKQYNAAGIGVHLTFNSSVITDEDLGDELPNMLLKRANGAIIASHMLNRFVHDNYPNVLRTASCILSIMPNKMKSVEHYDELCEVYDKVVVNSAHLFTSDREHRLDSHFLDRLDKSKIEIMVNDPCILECPYREHHQMLVAKCNKLQTSEAHAEVQKFHKQYCRAHLVVSNKAVGMSLTGHMVAHLQDMGFRSFKLVGRDMPDAYVLTEILRYIIPEALQAHANMSLSRIISSLSVARFAPVLQRAINGALSSVVQIPTFTKT